MIIAGRVAEAEGTRRLAVSIASLTLALLFVVLMALWAGLSLTRVLDSLSSFPFWLVPALTALTFLQFALSAEKWRATLRALAPEVPQSRGFGFFLTYSALSAMLANLMTVYLSSIVVRSWAVKRYHDVSLGRGATSSAFEQSFDAVVIVIMTVPTIVVWLFGGGLMTWVMLTLAAILLGAALVPMLWKSLSRMRWAGRFSRRLNGLLKFLASEEVQNMLAPRRLLYLYALAVVRYGVLALRVVLVVLAGTFLIGAPEAIQGFTLVQASQFASVTPGNLGVQEWSWLGVLSYLGHDLEAAAAFAIGFRVLTFVATALATAAILVAGMYGRHGRR